MSDNKTILVIEDEETLLNMYRLKFEASGFNFSGFTTGEAGLEIVKKQTFDIILVDLMLKNKTEGGIIDGYDVITQLKKDGNKAKIYALTNFDQDKSVDKAFTVGADGYLIKSDITPGELVSKVNDILVGKKVGVVSKK